MRSMGEEKSVAVSMTGQLVMGNSGTERIPGGEKEKNRLKRQHQKNLQRREK